MKSLKSLFIILSVCTLSAALFAGTSGAVSTDRFGYTGTVVRYATLADAQAGTNSTDTIEIGNRDLSLYIVNDYATYDDNYNIIMGSWWYSTEGSPGYGNTRGNTGIGFMQLYDDDSSTDTSIDMSFSNYDGTYWSNFNLNISGENTTVDDAGRFSVYDNVNDGGIWHAYNLALTATGLQGTQTSPGVIEAFNHPIGVTGTFSGLFQLTENQTSPANQGYYTVNLTLDMTNWAWENQDDLTEPYPFFDSYFATVPEPMTMTLLGLGGLFLRKRK